MSNPSPERGAIRRLIANRRYAERDLWLPPMAAAATAELAALEAEVIGLNAALCDESMRKQIIAEQDATIADLRAQLAHVLLGMELALIDLPDKPLDAAATLKVFAARVSADASKEP